MNTSLAFVGCPRCSRFFRQAMRHVLVAVIMMLSCEITAARGNYTQIQSAAQADSLQRLLAGVLPDTLRVEILNHLSRYHWRIRSNLDSAFLYADSAKRLASSVGFLRGQAQALINIGIIHNFWGKDSAAVQYYSAALPFYERLQDTAGIVKVYNALGDNFGSLQRQYAKGMKYLLMAIKLCEESHDTIAIHAPLSNIAYLYIMHGDYPKALEYFEKSLRFNIQLRDSLGIAICLANIGKMYCALHREDIAVPYYEQALPIFEHIGNQHQIALVCLALGNIRLTLGEPQQARIYFNRADHLSAKRQDNVYLTIALCLAFAKLHLYNKHFGNALDYARRAHTITLKLHNTLLDQQEALEIMSRCYDSLGQSAKAFQYYRAAMNVRDSIQNEIYIRQANDIREQYEFEKKNKEIALLSVEAELRTTELQRKRTEWWLLVVSLLFSVAIATRAVQLYREKKKVAEDLTTKNIFLEYKTQIQEVESQLAPHFLFNSLSALGGLIARNAKEEATEFLENLALTYRYVLTHKQQNLVTLEAELDFVQAYMYLFTTRFNEGLQVHIDIDRAFIHHYLPPMTLQLLVENAIKHNIASTWQPLRLVIQTERQNGAMNLVVRNNLQARTPSMGYKAMMSMSREFRRTMQHEESTNVGLHNLATRYRIHAQRLPTIEQTETEFIVTVPLLAEEEIVM